RRAPAFGAHPRRPNLALELSGQTAATVRGRALSPRRDAALRQPRHRLLGTANATRHYRRDHPSRVDLAPRLILRAETRIESKIVPRHRASALCCVDRIGGLGMN